MMLKLTEQPNSNQACAYLWRAVSPVASACFLRGQWQREGGGGVSPNVATVC